MRSRSSNLLLVAGSLVSFVLVLASPPMVSTADGCSGAAPYPVDNPNGRWESLTYPDDQIVENDTILVLRGKRHSLGDANGQNGVTVTVTDPSAQPVSGKTWFEPTDGQWPATSYVVWKPDEPLQPGATYTVNWNVKPFASQFAAIDGSTTILVATGSTLLPELETTSPVSDRTHALTGTRVTDCRDSYSCNIPPFGMSEIQPYGMRFSAKPPPQPNTYQALSIREIPGKGKLVDTYDTPWTKRRKVMASPWLEPQEFALWFSDVLPQYCVRLVQRDLRTGVERDKEVCVTRVDKALPVGGLLDDHLTRCWDPPAGLLGAWCKLNPTRAQCEGQPVDAGSSSDAGFPDGSSSDAGNANGTATPSGSQGDDAGCGCRMGTRSPSHHAFLLSLLIPLALRRRRAAPGNGPARGRS